MISATLRNLRRSPGFVAIAALSLGTALGLSTAVFGFIDAMRHPESAIRDVEQTYHIEFPRVYATGPTQDEVQGALKKMPMIAALAGYRSGSAQVEVSERVEQVSVMYTRDGLWELLGVQPRLGRLPRANEATGSSVALVSDEFWRSAFGNLPSIGPARLTIGGRQYTVVGVLPRKASLGAYVYIPDPNPAPSMAWVVRLRPGSNDKALDSLLIKESKRFTTLYRTDRDRYGTYFSKKSLRADPLELHDYHRALVGAALFILVIACANVAALMAARGMVRRRDYALQLALGAPTSAIFRGVFVEVIGLTVIGCVVGGFVAAWSISLITGATPEQMRWMGFVAPQWSWRVLAESAAAVFVSVAIAGGFPAWRASRIDPAGPLKESSGGNTGRISTRFRLLVMGELALAMTLLVSTSLMMKSVRKMENYDFGYDARSLIGANYWLWFTDTVITRASNETILAAVRALPSVQSAADEGGCSAMHQTIITDLTPEGGAFAKLDPSALRGGGCANVSSQFFTTLGLRVKRGRDFSDADGENGGAAILDEKTAHALFPHDEPIGHRIRLGGLQDSAAPWLTVVGIVADKQIYFNQYPELGADSSMVVFISTAARRGFFGRIVVRSAGDAAKTKADLQKTIRGLLPPRRTNIQVESWVQGYEDSLTVERFLSLMFAMLGTASLLLGAAGLFSVISYIANHRLREFAVRIALGAPAISVIRLVMKDALAMALGGTAVGAGLGMWCGFMLWDKMWGVYPVDAGALVGAELMLILVTMLACLAPALRASRADPLEIIRAA